MPEVGLLAGAVVAYAACALLGARALCLTSGRGREGLLVALLAAGVTLSGLGVALRWVRLGQGPFITFFDVLLSNVFTLGLAALACWILVPATRASAALGGAVLALLGAWALTLSPEPTRLPANFGSAWLWAHVATGKVFLGTCLVAAGLGVAAVARAGREEPGGRVRLLWSLLRIAFGAQTFMLISGAVWARHAWGRFWGWDSLETWALVTWLALGAALHLNARSPLAPRWAAGSAVAVLVLAHLTFLGVPFVTAAPHKGIAW